MTRVLICGAAGRYPGGLPIFGVRYDLAEVPGEPALDAVVDAFLAR